MSNLKKIILTLLVASFVIFSVLSAGAAEGTPYVDRCSVCHKEISSAPAIELHSESGSGLTYTNGKVSFLGGGSGKTYSYNLPTAIVGSDKAPYQIEFTLTFDRGTGSSGGMNNVNNNGNGKKVLHYDGASYSILRQYPITDGNSGWLTNKIDIGCMVGFGVAPVSLVRMSVGDSAKFTFFVTPESNTVDIYVNDEYKTTRTEADGVFSAASTFMTFGDSSLRTANVMGYTVSDFHILRTDNSKESEKVYTENAVSNVYITDKSFGLSTKCVCGNLLSHSEAFEQVIVADSVYYGNGVIKNIPTEGRFWIASNYNIRTDEALEAVKATEADIIFGDLAVAIDRAKLEAPKTYQIALNVSYPENSTAASVGFWVDGTLEQVYDNITLDDSIVLGSLDIADVRFTYTKIIEAGDSDAQIEYVNSVDASVKPCAHVADGYLNNISATVDGNISFDYECARCGEIVYSAPVDDYHNEKNSGLTYTEGSFSFSAGGSKYSYILPEDIIGVDKAPYQLEMTLKLTSIGSDKNKLYNSGNGRSLLRFSSSEFSILRQYPVSDGNEGYLNDTMFIGSMIDFGTEPVPLTQIKIGESVKFEFYIIPVEHKADIYVNGKYITTREGTDVISCLSEMMTFGDGNAPGCNYTVSDVHIFRPNDNHIHSCEWMTSDELLATTVTLTDDHNVKYSYQCYCGETVTYGISNAVKESVLPVYGVVDETVIVAADEFTIPEEDFWFLGNISTIQLPAEDGKSLVGWGDNILLQLNVDGELAVDGVGTGKYLNIDNEYHTLAFKFDVDKKIYTVYFDGTYVTNVEYETLAGDIKIASNGSGKYHFDSAAVVVLSENGDIAYKIAEGAHTHWYDPKNVFLEFNEGRSAITINYVCAECDRPVWDGIVKNLYDNETTAEVEAILPVFGVQKTIIEDSPIITGAKAYWISFDAVLKSALKQGAGCFFKFVDSSGNSIEMLTLLADGTVKDASGASVGKLKTATTNFTINVINSDEETVYHLYVDGKYCETYKLNLDVSLAYDAVIGADFATSAEFTNIKFAEIGNSGLVEIGTFVCADAEHIPAINRNSYTEYLNVNEFKFVSRCQRCGAIITEEIVGSFYESTPHIYEAYGDLSAVKTDLVSGEYWIVVDVNVRDYNGYFRDFVPLISRNGTAILLMNYDGELMFGDGTRLYRNLEPKTTYNLAIRYEGGVYYLFINGKYVNCTTGSTFKEGIYSENSYEYFGSPELKNIRYYNIKSIVTAVTDDPIKVVFTEDLSALPCVHEYHYFYNVQMIFDEHIKEVYMCSKCGERVVRVNDRDILDYTLNEVAAQRDFTLNKSLSIYSSEEYLSNVAAPYWVRFTVEFEQLPSAASIDKQRGTDFFSTTNSRQYGYILRMFAHETGRDVYADGVIDIRISDNVQSECIATIREGETHEFAIGIMPSGGSECIYMDGVLIYKGNDRTYNTDATSYALRLGAPGIYNISDFEFVTAGQHEHTAEYAQYMVEGYDLLEYSNTTLTHRYTCYCGAEVVEGIDKIYADEIGNIENVIFPTVIPEATASKVTRTPYWVSAKVYGSGSNAMVFSYNGKSIVSVEDGVYTVGGVSTGKNVSWASLPGDYDLVSIRVNSSEDKVDVYINGHYADTCTNVEIEDIENFNISLGGGDKINFRFIKVVSLAKGASGEVTVADCGNHNFRYSKGVEVVLTETGVDYKCKYCGAIIRSVAYDENKVISNNSKVTTANVSKDIIDGVNFYNTILNTVDGGSIWYTFKAKSDSISKHSGNSGGETMFKLQVGNEHGIYIRTTKIDNKTVEYTFYGTSAAVVLGDNTMKEGEEYTFVIEHDPVSRQYYVYVNGSYMGGNSLKLDYGETADYKFVVFGTANWEINDFAVFTPAVDEIKKVEADIADNTVHRHFPDVSKEHSMTVSNGEIYHEFTCLLCGNPSVKLTTVEPIVEDNADMDFSSITNDEKIDLHDTINVGTEPFVISFDFNVASIIKKGEGTIGFIFIYEPSTKRTLELLYGFPNADGGIDLRTRNDIDHPIIETINAGETVNITYVIDPTSQIMEVYVDGNYITQRKNFTQFTTDSVYLRIKNTSSCIFGFSNFQLGRMSDICTHIAPCGEDGVLTSKCKNCEKTVVPTHNYTEEIDRTNRWTKYTCEDCGAVHIEFNSLSQLKDIKFINEIEFMNYLSDKYCPVFKKAE